ncbi:uncharacterized protein LOC143283807 [Babylonia areolata]|uniref:uncharacterized protein LOC143283807 n=1 Tax=Babylonia areolata TaxID=304850 RepID=UPI003FD50D86
MARLLRAYNIDFKWHRLAAWINIIEQWPYRVSWIIYLFEELDVVENSTSLCTLYQRILPRIPVTKESEPLLEIDRNARKLDAFLSSQSPGLPRLNVSDLRKFLPCTINLDPYLRKLIRETEHQNEMLRQEINTLGGVYPGPQPYHPPPPPPPSSGASTTDSLNVMWNRPPPQGTSPNRFFTPHPPSIAGHSSNMGQTSAATGTYFAQAGQGLPSFRPHPSVFFSNVRQLSHWAELDVEGVCNLLAALKGVTHDVLTSYTQRIKENNISGLVLQNCDLNELRPVLEMRFGDWQLFKSAILSLREWDGCLLSGDSSKVTINNSAMQSTSGTSREEIKDLMTEREHGDKPMQGRVIGPKGRRMRRNDSIVQQLSYEAAILHEALEEFSEESDGDEEVISAQDLKLDNTVQSPLTEDKRQGATVEVADLSSMITVLDAPQEGVSQQIVQPSSFLLQSSFPSSAHFPEVAVSPTTDQTEHHSDSHKHHNPFFKTLSTGLEKMARPFISSFDNQHKESLNHSSEEAAESGMEKITLLPAVAVLESKDAALKKTAAQMAWDRTAFSLDASSSVQVREVPVSIEMTPTPSRAVFSVGSQENSPSHPTFRMENETTDTLLCDRIIVETPVFSPLHSQQTEPGPWQQHSEVHPNLLQKDGRPSPDKESFV